MKTGKGQTEQEVQTNPSKLVFHNFLWQRLAATLAGDQSPEALHDRVLALMNTAQTACFHTRADAAHPRKPWTSWHTAEVAMQTPPLQSALHQRRRALRMQNLVCAWFKWCIAVKRRPSPITWRRCSCSCVVSHPLLQPRTPPPSSPRLSRFTIIATPRSSRAVLAPPPPGCGVHLGLAGHGQVGC